MATRGLSKLFLNLIYPAASLTIVGVSGSALMHELKTDLKDITKDLEGITKDLKDITKDLKELETDLNELNESCGTLEDSVLASVKDAGAVENIEASAERRMQGCLVRAIRTWKLVNVDSELVKKMDRPRAMDVFLEAKR